jgi:hypothetical protein
MSHKRVPLGHKRPVLFLIIARRIVETGRNRLVGLSLGSLEATMPAVLGGRLYVMAIEITRVEGSK